LTMQQFAAGDKVWLKLGGEAMLIDQIQGDAKDEARCIWREGGQDRMAVYKLVVLTKVNPNQVEPLSMSNPR